MEQKRERGLKKRPDGRWQFSWCFEGSYHRRVAPTKSEARAYLEKIHTLIREGKYLDKKKEGQTTFETAVSKFLKWSKGYTRPSSHKNDLMNTALWLASPHFKGKLLDKITAGDVEQYRLDRLKDVDRRGPTILGLMHQAGRLYRKDTGRTLRNENRAEVRSALQGLLPKHSGYQVKRALETYYETPGAHGMPRLRRDLAAILGEESTAPRSKKLTKRTVDISLARLKRMFALCVDWGISTQNPAAKVKLFREDQNRTRYLSEEEEGHLLEVCDPYLRSIVLFAIHTGMRRGEILGLRWKEVDLRNAVATIPAAKAKGKRDRFVPLNTVAKGILEGMATPSNRTGLVFSSSSGKPNDNFERLWRAALEGSGLEDFRFHDLRHTFASRLVMAGVDLPVLRELLGHRDFEMTLRYAHLAPSHLKSAVAVLEPNLQKTCTPSRAWAESPGAHGA